MSHTTTYEWDEALGYAAERAYRQLKVARTKLLLGLAVVLLAVSVAAFLFGDRNHAMVVGGLCLYVVALQAFIACKHRRLVQDVAKFLGSDLVISVTVDDSALLMAIGQSNRIVPWDKLTKRDEGHGFLFLSCGKLLVAALPIDRLSCEQLEIVRAKVSS
jgi:hypothetical protein